MLPLQNKNRDPEQIENSPFGGADEPAKGLAMTLVALSHGPLEHKLYLAMFAEVSGPAPHLSAFSARDLMVLTGLNSFSALRRARAGLIKKLSIELHDTGDQGDSSHTQETVYLVFSPSEILARRRAAGLEPYPKNVAAHEASAAFGHAIERLLERHNLSRRETQVALCCAEGLTNAEIGRKLFIGEQTVKFHLRHVYIKCGVKRRAELISRLLM